MKSKVIAIQGNETMDGQANWEASPAEDGDRFSKDAYEPNENKDKKSFLVKGIKHIKPITSVTNPGVRSKAPPIAKKIPVTISSVGNSERTNLFLAFINVLNPCCRSSNKPITAVKRTSAMVLKAPMEVPTRIRIYISNIGKPMKMGKKYFIIAH